MGFIQKIGLVSLGCLWMSASYGAEVRLWHAYRGGEAIALQELANQFTKTHGTEVQLTSVPFGAFESKLATAIPRGNGPDVFIAAHSGLGKWSALGVVTPTDGDLSNHGDVAQEALEWGGEHYGWPLAYKTLVLLYDPSKITSPPRTTDALIAQAKAHTGDGAYGLVYEASAAYYHAPFMHGFGAYTIRNGKSALDSEAHRNALAFSKRLAVEEGIVPMGPTSELMSSLYNSGDAAFIISGPWFLGEVDRPIAAVPMPVVSETGNPARPYLTVEAVFLSAQAQEPVLGQAFAEFLSGEIGAEIRQDKGGQAVTWLGLPPPTDSVVRAVQAQALSAVLMPKTPDVANVWEALERALRTVMRGTTTPEVAMESAVDYHRILSRPAPDPAPRWPYVILAGVLIGALVLAGGRALSNPAFRRQIYAHRRDYLWVLPAGFAMLLLVVLPFVTGAAVSLFSHHNGEWTFVGIRHFIDILFSRDWPLSHPLSFGFTLLVTVFWTVSNVALHVGIGLGLALLLREPWVRLRTLWRVLLILPWAIPNYITALIWKTMFHVQYGAINGLLGWVIGADQPIQFDWFGSFATGFCANLVTNTWLGFPFMMVVTLGALQSIPRDLEEAATVDGAGAIFRFRHVIWPLLKPALLPAIILGSVWTFNMFNVIYLVSGGEPGGSTEILISEAYRWAFSRSHRYGYAAAYAVLIFGVLLVYSRGANRVVGRRVL